MKSATKDPARDPAPGNETGRCRVAPANGPEGVARMNPKDSPKAVENAKAAAMSAYSWGYLSLGSCAAMFQRNPGWRAA